MKRIARRGTAVLLLVAALLALWAFWWEPRRLVVRRASLALPCWRGEPVTFAIVSDLHVGSPGIDVAKVDRVVDAIQSAHADVVLLLGDFVIQDVIGGHPVSRELIAQHLGRLHAPRGVFAVLGNHDWWLDAPRVRRALESAGIRVMDDAAVHVTRGSGSFWLAGVSDLWEGPHDIPLALSGVTSDEPLIVMTHNPDIFPLIPPRVCLTLAGHTHGGQVAAPLIGRPIVSSRFGERYAIGHIHEHGKHLFVTSGVGTSIIPVRFRVPPEVVILRVGGG